MEINNTKNKISVDYIKMMFSMLIITTLLYLISIVLGFIDIAFVYLSIIAFIYIFRGLFGYLAIKRKYKQLSVNKNIITKWVLKDYEWKRYVVSETNTLKNYMVKTLLILLGISFAVSIITYFILSKNNTDVEPYKIMGTVIMCLILILILKSLEFYFNISFIAHSPPLVFILTDSIIIGNSLYSWVLSNHRLDKININSEPFLSMEFNISIPSKHGWTSQKFIAPIPEEEKDSVDKIIDRIKKEYIKICSNDITRISY